MIAQAILEVTELHQKINLNPEPSRAIYDISEKNIATHTPPSLKISPRTDWVDLDLLFSSTKNKYQ